MIAALPFIIVGWLFVAAAILASWRDFMSDWVLVFGVLAAVSLWVAIPVWVVNS